MHAQVLTHMTSGTDDRAQPATERVLALLLVVVMAAGSLLLWIGIPAASLWFYSQLTQRYTTVYALGLIFSPLAMAACAWILHRVNWVYLRLMRTPEQRRAHTAWLRSMSSSGRRQPRGVLEVCMSVSVVLAIITFTVWFFFFAGLSVAPYN
ncbi:MAG: hypothetical protein QOK04_2361 [Solirubrobacteraceae bacterium]|jgi:hypothetical protein|nr:hypothetical protein [Solirubrobacteraceae bacterium]